MKSLFLGAAAIAIIATAATAETPTKAQFVDKAGASDTFEIDSARLMVTSKNPAIMTFATQMLTDHTKSTKMVQAAAKSDGVIRVVVGRKGQHLDGAVPAPEHGEFQG